MKYMIVIMALLTMACGIVSIPLTPTITPSPDFAPVPIVPVIVADLVTVEYEHVNLHNPDGSASGITVSKGQVLAVEFQDSGWAEIVDGEWKGMLIWSGCLSESKGYRCENG